jgi:hypothetical protein
MKNNRTWGAAEAATTTGRWRPQSSALAPPMVRTGIALLVILTGVAVLPVEGQTLMPPDHGSQPAQTRPTLLSSRAAQGRQHPSYQVFAAGLAFPSITIVDKNTLDVGGKLKIDVSRFGQLTRQQKDTLAGQFAVAASVVDKFQANWTNNVSIDPAQVAGKLRVMMIDCKYLLEQWTQYLPPAGKEKVKADALEALRAGDIDKAWEMFLDLPRPAPPAGFGVVGQQ